jgi:hypothetical protein
MYKGKKYGNVSGHPSKFTPYEIDQNFIAVIQKYNRKELSVPEEVIYGRDFHYSYGVKGQPIFIDIIIKVMLCRVYTNLMDRKLLTAEKILDNAENLIKYVEAGSKLQIVDAPKLRGECASIHIEILEKKCFLQKGILSVALNKDLEAQDHFLDGMRAGITMDPRIKREFLEQMMQLMLKNGRKDMHKKLKSQFDSFRHRSKDVVILVSEYVKPPQNPNYPIETKIIKTLQLIFDSYLENSDQVSLMSFSKNTTKIIDLVSFSINQQ